MTMKIFLKAKQKILPGKHPTHSTSKFSSQQVPLFRIHCVSLRHPVKQTPGNLTEQIRYDVNEQDSRVFVYNDLPTMQFSR